MFIALHSTAVCNVKYVKRKQNNAFCKPVLNLLSFIQDASSIVSIAIGTDKVAWAHVDRAMTVLDWQQMECPSFLKGNYMASAYLNDVSVLIRL